MTEWLIGHIETMAAHAPHWGYALIFFFMTVESSFIPFPSEVVMIPAGFLAARGELSFRNPGLDAGAAVVAGILGSLAGAWINYVLALRLGRPFLMKYGRYFFLRPESLERAEQVFRTYGAGATFVCRLLPAIRQLISLPAGMARMPMGSFFLWTGLGAGIWVAVLTWAGFYFGEKTSSMTYAELIHGATALVMSNWVYFIPLLAVGFMGYLVVTRRIMRRHPSTA